MEKPRIFCNLIVVWSIISVVFAQPTHKVPSYIRLLRNNLVIFIEPQLNIDVYLSDAMNMIIAIESFALY